MKSNNMLIKKVLFILPLILLCVAFVLVATVGFNKSIDFKTYYQFDVKFSTTLTKQNIKDYQAKFVELAGQNNVKVYSQDVVNENINIGIRVKALAGKNVDDTTMQTRITAYQDAIKDLTGINDSAYITVENSIKVLPHAWGRIALMGALSILVATIVVFAYVWIRFELKLALSYAVAVVLGESMVFALTAILRLPISLGFMAPYFACFAMLTALFAFVFSKIKQLSMGEKTTNAELTKQALYQSRTPNIVLFACFALVLILCAIAYKAEAFATILQLLVGVFGAVYALMYVLLPMWCVVYNRANDKRLVARQKRLAEREANKDKPKQQDKLVV